MTHPLQTRAAYNQQLGGHKPHYSRRHQPHFAISKSSSIPEPHDEHPMLGDARRLGDGDVGLVPSWILGPVPAELQAVGRSILQTMHHQQGGPATGAEESQGSQSHQETPPQPRQGLVWEQVRLPHEQPSDGNRGERQLAPREVLAREGEEMLCRPCVDCGLRTGRFCDRCRAADRMPNEMWAVEQMTPLCSRCKYRHHRCHVCRGLPWSPPPPHEEWDDIRGYPGLQGLLFGSRASDNTYQGDANDQTALHQGSHHSPPLAETRDNLASMYQDGSLEQLWHTEGHVRAGRQGNSPSSGMTSAPQPEPRSTGTREAAPGRPPQPMLTPQAAEDPESARAVEALVERVS